MALLVASCSSAGGRQATPTSPSANAPTTVTTAPFTPVAVSRICLMAVQRLIADQCWPGPPSGEGGQAQWYAAMYTMTHCKSKDEWLSAAQEGTTESNAGDYSAAVLQRYCETRVNFGITFNPSDATSCAVRSTSLVANLGPCPKTPPIKSLKTLNTGVQRLDRILVPIDAIRVRICRYDLNSQKIRGTLAGVGALSGPVAVHVEDETNSLHRADQAALAESPTGMSCAGPFYLTFASRLQSVTVTATSCDSVTNGAFLAFGTDRWLNDVNRYTADIPDAPVSSPTLKGPTGPMG